MSHLPWLLAVILHAQREAVDELDFQSSCSRMGGFETFDAYLESENSKSGAAPISIISWMENAF